MSPGDRLERILKDMHVMLAKSPTVTGRPDHVILNRQEFILLLDRLSASVYEMMEVYEQTRQSRQAAERAAQRRGEEILSNASADAEDIYAASYVYTEDTIGRIRSLMDQTNDEMDDLFRKFKRELREQRDMLKVHESQLQAQLADLSDTKKYLNVIREINRQQDRLDRERKAAQAAGIAHVGRDAPSRADSSGQEYDPQAKIVREAFSVAAADEKPKGRMAALAAGAAAADSAGGSAVTGAADGYPEGAAVSGPRKSGAGLAGKGPSAAAAGTKSVPEAAVDDSSEVSAAGTGSSRIYVNPEYFEKTGTPLPGTGAGVAGDEPAAPAQKPEIRVNTDAAYFKWKEQQEAAKRKDRELEAEAGQDTAVQSVAEASEAAEPASVRDRQPDSGAQESAAGKREKKTFIGVRGKRIAQEQIPEGVQGTAAGRETGNPAVAQDAEQDRKVRDAAAVLEEKRGVQEPEQERVQNTAAGRDPLNSAAEQGTGQDRKVRESAAQSEEKRNANGTRSAQESDPEGVQESATGRETENTAAVQRRERETAAVRPARRTAAGAGASGESRDLESTERLSRRAYYEQTEEEELRYLEAQLMAEFRQSGGWPDGSEDRSAGEEAAGSDFPDEESIRQAVIADENEWEAERRGESGSGRTKGDAKRMFRKIIFGDD